MAKKPCGSEPALLRAGSDTVHPCTWDGRGHLCSFWCPAEVPQGSGAGSWRATQVPGYWEHHAEMLKWLLRSQVGSVKPSKELRLISLPDQSWHRCVSTTIPGCPVVLLCLPGNQSILDTDSPRERRAHCLLNPKGCSLQKPACAGLPQFPYSQYAL